MPDLDRVPDENPQKCSRCERNTCTFYCNSCDLFYDWGHADECECADSQKEHANCRRNTNAM